MTPDERANETTAFAVRNILVGRQVRRRIIACLKGYATHGRAIGGEEGWRSRLFKREGEP
jgi:hypothetical protein